MIPCLNAADEPRAVFQESLDQLRAVQEFMAQGKLGEAKAACAAFLEKKEMPAHHRWEAEERRKEIERLEKGLPARDPAAHRVALPQRSKPGVTLYVAVDGDDANPGTQAKPFQSLERARDAIRALKKAKGLPAGGVEVCIRGGRYQATKTFTLESEDSGTEASPIVYRAAKDETPCFRGGIVLKGFQPVRDDAVLAILPEESRGKVLCVDLKSLGVSGLKPLELGGFASGRKFITHPTQELFFNGEPQTLSRWPNQGFVNIQDVVVKDGETVGGTVGSKTGRFVYEGDRPSRWLHADDAWLYGYWCWGWADSYEPIEKIDPEKKEITTASPYPNYGFRKGQPFYAVNLLTEIDMPGEWYLDRKNAVLYFWPPSDPEKATVELSLNDFPFVDLQKVSHVAFEGFTWELAGGDAVHVKGGDHCLIAGCTIRRCGGTGVDIAGGTDHGVLACDIYSLGRRGVVVAGGDRKTLSPGRHFVENCNIYALSRVDHTYTPAVWMTGVGNRIAHNYMHDILSSAINLGGNDHVVEYNNVERVVLESDDQGGTDMFGDPTYRGNVFRFNFWHDIGNWRHPNEGPDCGQGGIRLDDAICGVLIYGNIFRHASAGKNGFGGVQIHGGKDNILDNNLFVECESAVSLSPWDHARWKKYIATWFPSDKVDADLYLAKYPQLAKLSEDINQNIVARSLVVQCPKFLHRDSRAIELFNNLETADDPGFRNAAHDDFQLKDASPQVVQIGMYPIPVEEIGLYIDALRKTLPPHD
jgi:hypothetical protein